MAEACSGSSAASDRAAVTPVRHADGASPGEDVNERADTPASTTTSPRCPTTPRAVVEELRRTIHAVVPGVGETIRYKMPTFTLDDESLVHIAAWKNHIGLYPLPPLDGELAAQRSSRTGVPRTPCICRLGKPVPYELVGRVVAVLAERHPEASRAREQDDAEGPGQGS